MKYRNLTKEQFESLHEEFTQFLASQKIDAIEWKNMKEKKTKLVEEELSLFSDMVWDDVLSKVKFIEHFSPKTINLFNCKHTKISRIVIDTKEDINFLEKEGYEWLLKNPKNPSIDYFIGDKKYKEERNKEIFKLIEQGGTISNGELFLYFKRLISQ